MKGKIVLVPFPFTDLTGVKQRPALVISNNEYNQKNLDVIICGITSNLEDLNYSVVIEKKDFVPALCLASIIQNGQIPFLRN